MSNDLIIQASGGNWEDVQDTLPPVPAGEYVALIEKYEVRERSAKAKTPGKNLVFTFRIQDEGPAKNRTVSYYIGFEPKFDETSLKLLMNCAGVKAPAPGEGFNVATLVGQFVRFSIATEVDSSPGGQIREVNTFPRLIRPGSST